MKSILPGFLSAAVIAVASSVSALAADVDVPRVINASTTWTADNTYFLAGYTFVVTPEGTSSPTVLTIEPGTVIKGRQKQGGGDAAALVVSAGAQINAVGTATEPIIFTSELDDLAGGLGIEDPNLWGGLVMLGNAVINSRSDSEIVAAPVTDQIEGFSVMGDEVQYITFGGTDDEDNSGMLKYVSIRHGGDVLGTANEINGLTLGGVGSGTTIEYIEVFANKDDGIEFFGGTVDVKHAVMAFGNDDGFDYDQGWRGHGQFWFVIGTDITTDKMDKAGEHDGATAPVTAEPLGGGRVFNATYIGIGPGGANNTALNIRDNAAAWYYNSVFTDFFNMIDIEDDAQTRFDAGEIDFENNVWHSHVAENNTPEAFNARPTGAVDPTVFWTNTTKDNVIADPMLTGISRTNDSGLDPRPMAGSPALTGPFKTVPAGDFFEQTDYKGAFAPTGATWLEGWTKLSTEGYLAASSLTPGPDSRAVNISTRCFAGTGDQAAIPGFVVEGTDPVQVLIRAVGPTLGDPPFGLSGVLADPMLRVTRDGATVAENDNWGENANAGEIEAAAASLGAFALGAGSLDSALLIVLEPGSYTAVTTGNNDGTGIVIVEVYFVPYSE